MNWSGRMWALQDANGSLVGEYMPACVDLYPSREDARSYKRTQFPAAKVVRVQVDVKVIE